MFGIDDAALATMLAGGISTAAALYTNKKNRDSQENANAINWEIARQNNAVQVEMANTAHQREVRDLRRAGLNPILSAGGSGAPTPSLQGASIDPVHTDNPFEGLANSAKGLTRYLGQQYKSMLLANQSQELSNEGQGLGNAGQALANEAASTSNELSKMDLGVARQQYIADHDNASADALLATNRLLAVEEMLGKRQVYRNGRFVEDWNPSDRRRILELQKEGIEADLKMRSNANWRANLSSFTPFVSPAAINSAGAAYRQFNPAVRAVRRVP